MRRIGNYDFRFFHKRAECALYVGKVLVVVGMVKLDIRHQKYQEAKQALEEFADTIEKTDRKWKMALAAMAMNEAAGQMEGDAFDKICIETALESVQTKLNQSFADLEIALLDNAEKSEQKKVEMASVVNDNKTQTAVNTAFNNAVRATSR
jgi:hypothetical protein